MVQEHISLLLQKLHDLHQIRRSARGLALFLEVIQHLYRRQGQSNKCLSEERILQGYDMPRKTRLEFDQKTPPPRENLLSLQASLDSLEVLTPHSYANFQQQQSMAHNIFASFDTKESTLAPSFPPLNRHNIPSNKMNEYKETTQINQVD